MPRELSDNPGVKDWIVKRDAILKARKATRTRTTGKSLDGMVYNVSEKTRGRRRQRRQRQRKQECRRAIEEGIGLLELRRKTVKEVKVDSQKSTDIQDMPTRRH